MKCVYACVCVGSAGVGGVGEEKNLTYSAFYESGTMPGPSAFVHSFTQNLRDRY